MKKGVSFRSYILLQMIAISVITLGITGTSVYFIRSVTTADELHKQSEEVLKNMTERTEEILSGIELNLKTILQAGKTMDEQEMGQLLNTIINSQTQIKALYKIDRRGLTTSVGTKLYDNPLHEDLKGIDFSYNPLYNSLDNQEHPLWSDKFVSSFTGDTSVGLGIRSEETAIIAEISLDYLLHIVETASDQNSRVWVVDGKGELDVDTGMKSSSGILNVSGYPFIQNAIRGEELPDIVNIQGQYYHPSAARSEKLGWIFLVGIPAGLDNPETRSTVRGMIVLFLSFILIALISTPLGTRRLIKYVTHLRIMAEKIAEGEELDHQLVGLTKDFNTLATTMVLMSRRIKEREQSLTQLNEALESRVAERTDQLNTSNIELKKTLQNLTEMQDVLVESEKHASLGRMVAGMAHELNTPIGNIVTIVTAMQDEEEQFSLKLQEGITRNDLEGYLNTSKTGMDIVEKNISRVAELVTSFKDVSSDQSSSIKRKFHLKKLIDDTLITLAPMIKKYPGITINTEIEDLTLNSYPGPVSQILTNLVTNALLHAWEDNKPGLLTISAGKLPEECCYDEKTEEWCRIQVTDNGRGIPEEIKNKIFDPFFTTRMGQGGTGLGLHIAYNTARKILGGFLNVEEISGEGTVFSLDIPLKAPVLKS